MDINELRQRKDRAPFKEHSMGQYAMYDKLPYTMDINICPKDNHKLFSGNIIKHFTYKLKETYFVTLN